ncbi:MAG: class II fructose-bisphosphate aldolase family protein [Clostridia bacterium]|nr:class II fructose-bisphosphate aldolase family protein [Clostridia bacterium]
MPLLSSKIILNNALQKNYLVGAFNVNNLELFKAVISTAEKEASPVIIQVSLGAIKYAGIDFLQAIVQTAEKTSTVNFALHLDHGKTFEDCVNAINHGFTSVMIDGSSLTFNDNVSLTKKVVDYAHKFNVSVEGEIGTIAGIEDNANVIDENSLYTNSDEAIKFAKLTGVDSLAIAIGTKHGAFKFAGEPNLKVGIAKEIHYKLPNLPLVLHGASNVPDYLVEKINKYGGKLKKAKGVPESIITSLIGTGICKINIDSDLRIAFTATIREYLFNNPECIDPREYLGVAMTEVQNLVSHKICLFNLLKNK